MKRLYLAALAAAAMAGAAQAAPGDEIIRQQCVACHAVTKPAQFNLARLWERKGPDLYYAGDKFQRQWLQAWLQNPVPVRPAGVMYAKAVKAGADKGSDEVDPARLAAHPKLDAAQAAQVADALLALKVPGLVEQGGFKNQPNNAMFATMLFSKLRGCASCHAAKPGGPVQSGPELYSAGARLQADYVVSYIRDPQKFDPHVWMPSLGLTEADVQKLASYLNTLKHTETK